MKQLYYKILRLDKKGYGAYKSLRGTYKNGGIELEVFHVQGDPFAQPSKLIYRMPREQANFSSKLWGDPKRRVAAADFLHRLVYQKVQEGFAVEIEEGYSGKPYLKVPQPLEFAVPRTAVMLTDQGIEFRFFAGLPGTGRKVEARPCATLLCDQLTSLVGEVTLLDNEELEALENHVDCFLRQEFIREELTKRDWVAFVEEGSILPRESGRSQKPMLEAIPFESPKDLFESFDSPWGEIKGMALGKGLNLIVGGAFHGKSTLLDALKFGVYNHIPGDGREGVVTLNDSVELRSENGRSIRNTNMSPMFTSLPHSSPSDFSTDDASGSTSQVSSLVEALQVGAKLLLMDEDECSVNFLYKDNLMKQLISNNHDSLNPLLDCLPQVRDLGVSLILVAGASGEYFQHSDRVIVAQSYKYLECTQKAKEIQTTKTTSYSEGTFELSRSFNKEFWGPLLKSVQHCTKPRFKDTRALVWCGAPVDASKLSSLCCNEQSRALLKALQKWVFKYSDKEEIDLAEMMDEVKKIKMSQIDDGGSPDFAMFHEIDFWRVFFRTPFK